MSIIPRRPGVILTAASIMVTAASSGMAANVKSFPLDADPGDTYVSPAAFLPQNPPPGGGSSSYSGPSVGLSFAGVTERDAVIATGYFTVPPDTMGAVGATQYMETSNSAYAIFDKTTGARTSIESGDAFWAAAGVTNGFGGDSRVRFDQTSGRWIATALSGTLGNGFNIAVSDTSDASGPWHGVAVLDSAADNVDYPTLALDRNAVYIGTNNFDSGLYYSGTSLYVIPRASLFAAAPSLTNAARFDNDQYASNGDLGFAIQGLNTTQNTGKTGGVIADSLYTNQLTQYNVTNAGTPFAALTAPVDGIGPNYDSPNLARQPDGSQRIDTLDARVSSSAWLQNGKIYTVFTVDDGTGHSAVNWEVIDATSNAVISQGLVSGGGYDYYQGSLAVNASGQVVLGYNRSGFQSGSGNIAFFARTFDSAPDGSLVQTGSDILLHQSALGDYNNREFGFGDDFARWGDYSSVTIDPDNPESFWAIGEYQAQDLTFDFGDGPDQYSSWGTWISDITLAAVPEPSTWAMMLFGLALTGVAIRRRAAPSSAAPKRSARQPETLLSSAV